MYSEWTRVFYAADSSLRSSPLLLGDWGGARAVLRAIDEEPALIPPPHTKKKHLIASPPRTKKKKELPPKPPPHRLFAVCGTQTKASDGPTVGA